MDTKSIGLFGTIEGSRGMQALTGVKNGSSILPELFSYTIPSYYNNVMCHYGQ